jgi:DNA-binding transcriptional MerR regulator
MSLEPSIPGVAADDYQTAIAQGFMPIRDVARITGVNAVTLRAWERRYGLIVPHRTPKGHRLYAEEHVLRIQAILTWLNRGVSVSQVKGLLRASQPVFSEASSQWEETRQQLQEAICNFNERRLDEALNSQLALYPISNCVGATSSVPRPNGCFSIPGCAASSVRACTTTTASTTGHRCC